MTGLDDKNLGQCLKTRQFRSKHSIFLCYCIYCVGRRTDKAKAYTFLNFELEKIDAFYTLLFFQKFSLFASEHFRIYHSSIEKIRFCTFFYFIIILFWFKVFPFFPFLIEPFDFILFDSEVTSLKFLRETCYWNM